MFDGRLIERGSPDYEAARVDAIFNQRRPPRFPSAVLEARSEADVVAGVRLARDRGRVSPCGPADIRGRRGACTTTRS